jgi:hypothetical protein
MLDEESFRTFMEKQLTNPLVIEFFGLSRMDPGKNRVMTSLVPPHSLRAASTLPPYCLLKMARFVR